MARARHRRAAKRGYLIAGLVVALATVGCSSASIEDPDTCTELRQAWEDAGGPVANYSTQVRTVERVTELGGSAGAHGERARCSELFDAAYTAANCSAPDTPPAFRSCSEG